MLCKGRARLLTQERFIRAYLDSALALQHCTGFVASDRTEAALEEAAAQLLQAANAYIPMSHLIWGLWGLLQVCHVSCAGLIPRRGRNWPCDMEAI